MEEENLDSVQVVKTEVIYEEKIDKTSEITWERVERKMQIMCANNIKNLVKFTVKRYEEDHQRHHVYGFFICNVHTIMDNLQA
jgi:copine 5/8/9